LVFTLKGRIEVKRKYLKEATGRIYQGDKTDEKKMTSFLNEAVKREKAGKTLRMDPKQILDSIDPEDLWRSVIGFLDLGGTYFGTTRDDPPVGCHERAFSPSEIGHIHFDPFFLDPGQIRSVKKILSRCDDRGDPFFNRIGFGKETFYFPYSKAAVSSMNRHIQRLEDLRSVFLEWVEQEMEGRRRRRKVPRLKTDDISKVMLGKELQEEMDRICGWATFYLENGWWPMEEESIEFTDQEKTQGFGLADTPVRRIKKFDLEKYIGYLAMDLTSTKKGHLSSSLITLLLELGRIDWRQASELVVKFNMGSGIRMFHEVFPNHVMKVSERLPDMVMSSDKEGRLDLAEMETYTIDPTDAKDFDDAVSILMEGENTVVWVHIADVTHYVNPNDLIDGEARYRGTSVYLPTRVIPMLPRKLSEELCSLNEGVERLAVSTKIVISPEMEVLEWDHYQSVIMVDRNLSYDTVNDWIEEEKEPFLSLHKLAVGLEEKGKRLNLNTPERRIRFRNGYEVDIQIKRPSKATKLIEELMVLTNECAARFLEEREVELPFRVHPLPDRTSAEKFNAACEAIGSDIRIDPYWESGEQKGGGNEEEDMMKILLSGGKIDFKSGSVKNDVDEEIKGNEGLVPPLKEQMDSAVDSLNDALDRIKDLTSENLRDLLNMRLLRTLSQAFYSADNIGHFGLRSMCYCHFTSPIRRYPDIVVHRALKYVISEESGGPIVGWNPHERDEIDDLLEHTNEMSESAEDWERDMVDVALATRIRMSKDLYKSTYSGMITSITPSSCFVLLDDGVTEGRMSIRDMSRYPLTVDEFESRILIEMTDEIASDPRFNDQVLWEDQEAVFLKLGDKVKCSIASVSIADGQIDLNLI
jgi:exoribonuclease R